MSSAIVLIAAYIVIGYVVLCAFAYSLMGASDDFPVGLAVLLIGLWPFVLCGMLLFFTIMAVITCGPFVIRTGVRILSPGWDVGAHLLGGPMRFLRLLRSMEPGRRR